MAATETIDFIPLVKAYPALSRTYGEVSCVAGVQMLPDGPRWIRLYPVAFRSLQDDKQFRKYQPLRVHVSTHRRDLRPETRRPDRESIELLGDPIPSSHAWARRRRFVEPLMLPSMCELGRRQRRDGTSLGVFRPARVLDLVIEKASVDAGKRRIALAWLAQTSLLDGLGSTSAPRNCRSSNRPHGRSSTATSATSQAAAPIPSPSSIGRSSGSTGAYATTTTGETG